MGTVYRDKLIKFLLEKVMELENLNEWRSSEIDRLKVENEHLHRVLEKHDYSENKEEEK